ncbi:MAG TPA: FAD-binding oxidoreductase, partial [Microthrixaceae bacterium]|nr:FAD-binding oxidoreductase [Microthrixaceae bacterium]
MQEPTEGRERPADAVWGTGEPVAPIAVAGGAAGATAHFQDSPIPIDDATIARLRSVCDVVDDPATTGEASRDWWPLAMIWATEGQVPQRAAAVARPSTQAQVADVLKICNSARIPVTAAGGRSGVAGASVPRHGGLVLDMCALSGIRDVDDKSLIADVLPGTFGDRYEDELRSVHSLTGGHWPQSMALSTVGGWLACRGAGQLSTRYGKIEDLVVGLNVVLADGSTISTGGHPRAAVGPDLNQLFVGSEGTLGIITGARLRVFPTPPAQRVAAYSFASFEVGMDWCRRILRRGATPAVLRLYDSIESERHYQLGDDRCVAIVMDEGDPVIIDAAMAVVAAEATAGAAEVLPDELVSTWFKERNNVAALE